MKNTYIDYSIVDGEKEYFLCLNNTNIRIGDPSWNYQKIVELQNNYNTALQNLQLSNDDIPPENKFKVRCLKQSFKVCWKRALIEECIEEIIATSEEEALDICEENIVQYKSLETYYDDLQFETCVI